MNAPVTPQGIHVARHSGSRPPRGGYLEETRRKRGKNEVRLGAWPLEFWPLEFLDVDNDELLCEMTVPAISSIPVNDHERGRAVGEAMDALLERRPFYQGHASPRDRPQTRRPCRPAHYFTSMT